MSFPIRGLRTALLSLCSLTSFLTAQDGGQLYGTYCAACHAPDGKGATGGQFPPLAGSLWVAGDADRAIKVILHGLQGPVDVAGKRYNLVMPPQGTALPDDQIAAILTYVRSSWGNRGSKVTTDQVAAIRKATTDRTAMWTQEELFKLHPLPTPKSAVENPVSYQYHGSWEKLPDFSKLEAVGVEEEAHGFMLTSIAGKKVNFGLVWEGDLMLHGKGPTRFRLSADDGARVLIDGETVVEVDGIGGITKERTKTGKVMLKGKKHRIRVEYFQSGGGLGLQLDWKRNGVDHWQRLGDPSRRQGPAFPSIPIAATPERAAIYRNFIAGTTPRAIGVGLPGGVNFAYSADHFGPELIWTGNFMDGGRHWTNRGQGAEPPAGRDLIKLHASTALSEGSRFRGYRLDPAGNPTFTVTLGKTTIEDAYLATGEKSLQRTLTIAGSDSPTLLLSENLDLKQSKQGWQLGGNLEIRIEGAATREEQGKLVIDLPENQSTTITYIWK